MGSILYVAMAVAFGYAVCETCFPNLKKTGEQTFDGRALFLSSYFVRIPAWVVAGLVPMTWVTYLTAYVLKTVAGNEEPLFAANVVTMLLFAAVTALLLLLRYKKTAMSTAVKQKRLLTAGELVFFSILLLFVIQLIFCTFIIVRGNLYVGFSVHSDFAPHMGMIRSFSYGNNFPTEYSHFAGEDIRYHFLFQFLAGNLEFLGMRVDFAFNLPSIFGVFATCMLLYALAVKLSGKRVVGYLTTLFFLFRSSPSFFRFLAELPKGELWKTLATHMQFLEYTQNEGWGLWNLNVYCNQRHLAFALVVLLLALHFFLPYVYEMAEKLAGRRAGYEEKKGSLTGTARFRGYMETLFFTKTAFWVKHPLRSFLLGILLGGLAFFNGSVVTACCAMLFFMAAVSDHRLDYLITAGTALVLSLLEAKLFIDGSAVSPSYFFGFIAKNKTFFGALDYMWQLWGILLLFLLAYFLFGRGVKRYLVFVFSVPLIMAFTVSLTVDVTVNHKFVMMSEMLLSLFPAIILGELLSKTCTFFENRLAMRRVAATFLIVALTITGFFEYLIIQRQYKAVYAVNDPLTLWVKENADAEDVFLTAPYSLNTVVLGGGMLFYGWPYYAWSAGYDTDGRAWESRMMFEAESPEELDTLVKENNIRYIIVDAEARDATDFFYVREDVISAAYEAVYQSGEGDTLCTIYDTKKPLMQ